MNRRTLLLGTLGASAFAAGSSHADSPAAVAAGAAAPTWSGARVLSGGKGYAQGPLGQIHYRDIGPREGVPYLLIHQSPLNMVEFAEVQAALAAKGRRAIAVDNPGFGLSDPPPHGVTVEQLADHLIPLLDQLAVRHALVAGHHTGASIAGAFAARHPDRTAGVILHGVPIYTAAERSERLARTGTNIELHPDGSHFTNAFAASYKVMGAQPGALPCATWATLGILLAGPSTPTYKAVFAHDLEPDLRAIRAPGLIVTDTGDILHEHDKRARAVRPDLEFAEFSDGGSPALMQQPTRWAEMALAFAARRGI